GALPQRRVGTVPAALAPPRAGHAVHGGPGVQRLRALAAGAGYRCTVALALRGQPPVARPSHARRWFVPQCHPSHRSEPQRGDEPSHRGARHRIRLAGTARRRTALPSVDHVAGPGGRPGAGTGSGVPPALGDRGRVRRAQDAPQAEAPRAAQQDGGARASGVLWLGAGTLLGALAAASGRHAASNGACRVVLHRACAAAAPRTAPLRGLSPQRARDVDDDGSMNCSKSAPGSAPRARGTSVRRGWSSGATRLTHHSTTTRRRACPRIALPRSSALPDPDPNQPTPIYRAVSGPSSSKRTVLGLEPRYIRILVARCPNQRPGWAVDIVLHLYYGCLPARGEAEVDAALSA